MNAPLASAVLNPLPQCGAPAVGGGTAPIDIAALIASRTPGHSLPQAFYTHADVFAADLERFFYRRWLNVGHVAQLLHPGDFFTYEIGRESIILSRGQDGVVHANFNVCRHRGSRICTEASGHVGKLVCPYHQWVYDHDGSLLAAKDMPENFDRSQFGLKTVPLRELEGFLFVCLAPAGEALPPFEPIARDVGPFLKPHGYPTAKIAYSKTYDVPANWKLIIENSRECYHCAVGHPEYSSIMAPMGRAAKTYKEYHADRIAHYSACGLPTKRVGGAGHHVSRYPLSRPEFVTESEDGRAVAPRMVAVDDHDAGVCGAIIHPNFMLEGMSDYTVRFIFTPVHATLTRVQADWFVKGDAVEGKDYDLARVIWFWKATGEQDWKLCSDNQAGVNSSRYEPGPYAAIETGVEEFITWYLKILSADEHR
ncbi:MAG TPA: aromatic ring-hydroxylating dioxygenase subunit alpha [Planctomycetota bacterium]|nr:aromatic ring-hydroxylating dioxygenase subunit alpha [Planctomycetota bacterium]